MLRPTHKSVLWALGGLCLLTGMLGLGMALQGPAANRPAVKPGRTGAVNLGVMVRSADRPVPAGALHIVDKEGVKGECPLKHTDVRAEVAGFLARVRVTQEFHNPLSERIEAVYVFPLSADAAVDEMTITAGERTIRGQIKTREEARQIYEKARAAGHLASLLDQERPNIFTQSVANLQPGETVKVQISYVEFLNYEDGRYQFVFPTVVGPRYVPRRPVAAAQGPEWEADTDKVPDAARITPPITPEGTRAGHDISLTVVIDAGVPLGEVRSQLHEIDVDRRSAHQAEVRLKNRATIPNKDFILTYETAGSEIADGLLWHATPTRGGFFSLILQPPHRVPAAKITPKELIFVIDTSGSQMGWPIEKAKETMEYCINHMNPDDTFQLLGFSDRVVKLFDRPQSNTEENRKKGLEFLATRTGQGGTELLEAVLTALQPPPTSERLRIVCFMTDGYVGDDMQVIDAVRRHVGSSRLFVYGVGNAVNRFLLDKMGETGRGAVEYVTLNMSGEAVARRFHDRIANPVLTDIQVEWEGLPVADVYPARIPDLFSARPLVIKGRYRHGGEGRVRLRGRVAGRPFQRELRVVLPDLEPAHDVLATLWARARVDDLMSQDYSGIQRGRPLAHIKDAITKTGLDFNLMTQYTSFVAVEERVVTEDGQPRTIRVPVEMPDGVSYDGIFGGAEEAEKRQVTRSAPHGLGLASFGTPGFVPSADAASRVAIPAPVIAGSQAEGIRGVRVREAGAAGPVARPAESKPLKDARAQAPPQKLHPALLQTVKALTAAGRDEERVAVAVWLNAPASECLKALAAAGFKPETKTQSARRVVGRIAAGRLRALAALDCVVRIEPPRGLP